MVPAAHAGHSATADPETPPPDSITIDCSTGEVICMPLTPDQMAAQAAAAAEAAQQQAAADAAQQQLLTTISASTDPAVQALAKLMGVIPS